MTCKDCKRQASWNVTFYDGRPAPTKSGTSVYCKAHCDDEIARLRNEMPDAERKRRYDLERRRLDTLHLFTSISYEIETIGRYITLLETGSAQDTGWGSTYTTPDPIFAKHLRGVLAALGDVALLRRCIESLTVEAKKDFPPAEIAEEETS